jgi:hypothetical protein
MDAASPAAPDAGNSDSAASQQASSNHGLNLIVVFDPANYCRQIGIIG